MRRAEKDFHYVGPQGSRLHDDLIKSKYFSFFEEHEKYHQSILHQTMQPQQKEHLPHI